MICTYIKATNDLLNFRHDLKIHIQASISSPFSMNTEKAWEPSPKTRSNTSHHLNITIIISIFGNAAVVQRMVCRYGCTFLCLFGHDDRDFMPCAVFLLQGREQRTTRSKMQVQAHVHVYIHVSDVLNVLDILHSCTSIRSKIQVQAYVHGCIHVSFILDVIHARCKRTCTHSCIYSKDCFVHTWKQEHLRMAHTRWVLIAFKGCHVTHVLTWCIWCTSFMYTHPTNIPYHSNTRPFARTHFARPHTKLRPKTPLHSQKAHAQAIQTAIRT